MAAPKRLNQLLGILNELPEDQLSEVEDFAKFLKAKKRKKRTGRAAHDVVKLEGLWKRVPFDVTDKDVREARRELGQQIATRARKAR
jgi:hypothetical protein